MPELLNKTSYQSAIKRFIVGHTFKLTSVRSPLFVRTFEPDRSDVQYRVQSVGHPSAQQANRLADTERLIHRTSPDEWRMFSLEKGGNASDSPIGSCGIRLLARRVDADRIWNKKAGSTVYGR